MRRVINEYAEAMQNKDLNRLRGIMPNMSGADEDKLRAAFANKSWRVKDLSVSQVLVENGQATVRASRNDNVDGRSQSVRQTFTLTNAEAPTIRA